MSIELRNRIFGELDALVLIDPHTHINALDPASSTLADILGYHYYTELAHSAGMPKAQIEDPDLEPREKCRRLFERLGPIDNTIQYSWLVEMSQRLFGFTGDRITADNWESVYDAAEEKMAIAEWPRMVLEASKLEKVFLTNNFDDPLDGFDTNVYVPCLRTDDLVFQLNRHEVRERLERTVDGEVRDVASLRTAIGKLFQRFHRAGARACAISLPPTFQPTQVSEGRAATALDGILRKGTSASEADQRAAANFVFWTLAEHCSDFHLPFDLMIGVNRGVYEEGVYQGQDLYDSRVSLLQYRALFNAFPRVVFPISVLASVTNQELTSYAWIFPNVVTNGHWWYSNTPTFIEHDAAARLEAVPRTKQIGYYSDMYKLEFALPKFAMYKRILAKILAERFVIDRGWSEEQAVELGRQVLRGNVEDIFFAESDEPVPTFEDSYDEETPDEGAIPPIAAAVGPAAAAGSVVETLTPLVDDDELVAFDEPTTSDEPLVRSDELAGTVDAPSDAQTYELIDEQTDEQTGEQTDEPFAPVETQLPSPPADSGDDELAEFGLAEEDELVVKEEFGTPQELELAAFEPDQPAPDTAPESSLEDAPEPVAAADARDELQFAAADESPNVVDQSEDEPPTPMMDTLEPAAASEDDFDELDLFAEEEDETAPTSAMPAGDPTPPAAADSEATIPLLEDDELEIPLATDDADAPQDELPLATDEDDDEPLDIFADDDGESFDIFADEQEPGSNAPQQMSENDDPFSFDEPDKKE